MITGAQTGIGRAAAVAFAHEAAHLVVSGRREKQGQDLVDQAIARFGHLDVAVNCAGTEGKRGLVTEQTAETYAAMFDYKLAGYVARREA